MTLSLRSLTASTPSKLVCKDEVTLDDEEHKKKKKETRMANKEGVWMKSVSVLISYHHDLHPG